MQVLALLPHSKKTLGSIPAWVPVCSGWLSRWGLSVWSLHVLPVLACILRISSIRTPAHQKHAERSPVLSPDQDVDNVGTGPRAPPMSAVHCSWLPLGGRDSMDGKMQRKHFTSHPMCVHTWPLPARVWLCDK